MFLQMTGWWETRIHGGDREVRNWRVLGYHGHINRLNYLVWLFFLSFLAISFISNEVLEIDWFCIIFLFCLSIPYLSINMLANIEILLRFDIFQGGGRGLTIQHIQQPCTWICNLKLDNTWTSHLNKVIHAKYHLLPEFSYILFQIFNTLVDSAISEPEKCNNSCCHKRV